MSEEDGTGELPWNCVGDWPLLTLKFAKAGSVLKFRFDPEGGSAGDGRAGEAGSEPDRSGLAIISFPIVRGKAGSNDNEEEESLIGRPLW